MTLLDDYRRLQQTVARLEGQLSAAQQQAADAGLRLRTVETEASVLSLTTAALGTLLQVVGAEAIAGIEQLVSYGLRAVFEDPTLSFRLAVSTSRGVTSVEPRLIHGKVEAPILDAFGGGPATLAAFLLRVLVCRRVGLAPVVLLDESFGMVSEQYVPNVAKLLRELADRLGFIFVLVTHQPAFLEHATVGYEGRPSSNGAIFTEIVQ